MVRVSQYEPAVPGSSPASSAVAEFVFRTSRAQIPGPMILNTPILLLLFVCLFLAIVVFVADLFEFLYFLFFLLLLLLFLIIIKERRVNQGFKCPYISYIFKLSLYFPI